MYFVPKQPDKYILHSCVVEPVKIRVCNKRRKLYFVMPHAIKPRTTFNIMIKTVVL